MYVGVSLGIVLPSLPSTRKNKYFAGREYNIVAVALLWPIIGYDGC